MRTPSSRRLPASSGSSGRAARKLCRLPPLLLLLPVVQDSWEPPLEVLSSWGLLLPPVLGRRGASSPLPSPQPALRLGRHTRTCSPVR